MADSDSEPESHMNMFVEPEDYYPPTPPPTTQTYTRTTTGEQLTLHLVGYSPTEAHHLWNGARVISEWFEADPAAHVRGRAVLELGAGAGLPSIVAAALGARRVVVTDYPDPDIVETMERNLEVNAGVIRKGADGGGGGGDDRIVAKGYVWGADVRPLLAELPGAGEGETGEGPKFDVLILADLLFRHSEHGHMLDTIRDAMARGGAAYVFFTSYRPWLRHKDLAFFDLARERGFVVEKVLERRMERPMFEDDPGDEEVRKTCTGWVVRWPHEGEVVGQAAE